ncbi:MAG TPA: oligoendopeptidase F, partial [Candidatus Nanoarchaeia archaeon]|nr:oligoendopeptidase F [Candidatus Nanoarchaeia archaeon]
MKYQLSSWDLSEIKPVNLEFTFQEIEKKTAAIEKQRSSLTEKISVAQFLNLLRQLEELHLTTSRLGIYAQLQVTENSANQEATALSSRVDTFLAKIGNRTLFFTLWFKSLSETKAAELIRASRKYHYFFERIRKNKPYTLQENEEKIISIKDTTGVSALNSIYNILCSQLEFQFQGKKLRQEELLVFVRDPSAKKREAAYRTLLAKYQAHKDVIGEIYKNIVNDWREENVHLRSYKNPIHVRNVANDLPDQAVEALLKVCEQNQSVFHRFFELKRKKLGLKKIRRFDLYAPLQKKKESKIQYQEAVT